MSLGEEFKAFVARGNVVDLAVAVIIGAAFGKIVTSLVDQILMPPIGLLLNNVDFSQLKYVLQAAGPGPGQTEVAIHYGAFANTIIQFAIIASVIFLIVRLINRIGRKAAPEPVSPAAPTRSEALLEDIRDALRSGKTS